MVQRSNLACFRCGGPAVHPGVCADNDGDVYPAYAALAADWAEQGRPAVTVEEVIAWQEALLAAQDEAAESEE